MNIEQHQLKTLVCHFVQSILRTKNTSAMIWIVLFTVYSCGLQNKPVDFKPGKYNCEFCLMRIVDMRFRGEIISKKGKIHHFDSVECLSSWMHDHSKIVKSAWVADFLAKEKWVKLSEAYVLQSSQLKSPMGAGLSAYRTEQRFEKAKTLYAGHRIEQNQLVAFIKNWRQEALHSRR